MAQKTGPTSYRRSKQRDRLLELLQSTETHPTADWLYDRLKREFPRLSLGTVYRNLSILLEQGLIHKIHFGSTHDRFEARVMPHYHLICEDCHKIFEFEDSEVEAMEFQLENGTLTDSADVHFRFALGKAYEDRQDYDKASHSAKLSPRSMVTISTRVNCGSFRRGSSCSTDSGI